MRAVRPSTASLRSGWLPLCTDPDITFSVPSISRPDYLSPILDPTFGTKITRITGDPSDDIITGTGSNIGTWGTVARHWYSKVQPWNCDESLIYLYYNTGGSTTYGLILDGHTYKPVRFLSSPPTYRLRWHPRDPELMYYGAGTTYGTYNVLTDATNGLHSFTGYNLSLCFMGEGSPSFDGQWVGITAEKQADGHNYVFAYDTINDVVGTMLDVSEFTAFEQTWNCFDWATISPSGTYVVVYYHNCVQRSFDHNMNLVYDLEWPQNHSDVGMDENGDDVLVGGSDNWYVCNYTGPGEVLYGGPNGPLKTKIVKQRLSDGEYTQCTWTSDYSLKHTSCRSDLRPGWCYNWYNSGDWGDEIVAVSLKGNNDIQRFCHMHNGDYDYYEEAHPCPSHDGRRVMFASSWDEGDGRPVGCYVVDARAQGT